MDYLEKLIKLKGKKPEGFAYYQKIIGETEQQAAKSMFTVLVDQL